MLTTEAFNALLKTLEEPPEHVVFVLCTTEPQKVPATILSRCVHIMFYPATSDELVRSFERIAEGEGIKIKKEVLEMIALLSDSGFRDGAKILEELVMLSHGKEISVELVEEKYKVGSINSKIYKVCRALSIQDTKSAVGVVENLGVEGIDVKHFLLQLLERLHLELLRVVGVEEKKQLKGEELYLTSEELQFLLEIFGKAGNEMKFAVIPEIPVELAIVQWGSVMRNPTEKATDIVEKRGIETNAVISEVHVSTKMHSEISEQGVTLKTMRKNLGNMAKIKALYGEDSAKQNTSVEEVKTSGVSLLHYDKGTDTNEWTNELWKNIISEMKTHNHTVAGVLRGCRLVSYDKKSVVIEALYKFHKEKLDEGKNMDVLVKICRQLTGNEVMVSVVLKSK